MIVPNTEDDEHHSRTAEKTDDLWTVPRMAVACKLQREKHLDSGRCEKSKPDEVKFRQRLAKDYAPVRFGYVVGNVNPQ